jgi:activator of HSP90 ATPase
MNNYSASNEESNAMRGSSILDEFENCYLTYANDNLYSDSNNVNLDNYNNNNSNNHNGNNGNNGNNSNNSNNKKKTVGGAGTNQAVTSTFSKSDNFENEIEDDIEEIEFW